MLHRFELHAHSWYSADAAHPPEMLIDAARHKGLSGLAITDHDSCEVHDYLRDKGFLREDGKPVDGFLIIPGVEISTADGHLLCLGTALPYLKGRPADEVLALVHERGGIAAPAHPFDSWRSGIRPAVLDQLPLQALEVFNAAVTSASTNTKAVQYAQERGLVGWAGSDAHHAGAIGMAVTVVDIAELCLPAVLAALVSQVTREERYLSRRQGLQKHFANWFRFTKTQRPSHPFSQPAEN